MKPSGLSTLLAGLVALSSATIAHAAEWKVGNVDTSAAGDFAGLVTSYVIADPDGAGPAPKATLTAWSNTLNGTNLKLESAYMDSWAWNNFAGNAADDGYDLGIRNKDYVARTNQTADSGENQSPEHSIDNDGRYDMVLFKFDSAIQLDSIKVGWYQTDTDMTVLAYTGVASLDMASYANGYADITASNGWSLVGHINGGAANDQTITISNKVTASYWLIGAYNPTTGFGAASGTSGINSGNDYLKLYSVIGSQPTTQVPEPATLGLLGIGLLGMVRLRRRQR